MSNAETHESVVKRWHVLEYISWFVEASLLLSGQASPVERSAMLALVPSRVPADVERRLGLLRYTYGRGFSLKNYESTHVGQGYSHVV